MTRYASRKFAVAMAAIASASWLVYAGHIADGVYSAVVIAAVTGYLAANVTQKATAKEGA
jgi:hypothetical protein